MMRTSTLGGGHRLSANPSRIVSLVAAVFLLPALCLGQGGRASDNILFPQPPLPIYVGPEVGFSQWTDNALFSVGDGSLRCADFADGDGNGPAGGLKAAIYVTPWLFVAPRIRYEARSGSFLTDLGPEPARDARDSVVMISRGATADVTMAALTLDARIGVELFGSGLYLSAGPAASLMMSGTYDYTERITGPPGFVFSSSGGSSSLLAEGRSFERYESLVFDLRGGAGYLFEFGPWAINPEVYYIYPLSSALTAPELMKQTGLTGSLGVLYNLGEVR